MADIVQRLRDSVRAARAIDRSALLAEAADEIERLRLVSGVHSGVTIDLAAVEDTLHSVEITPGVFG